MKSYPQALFLLLFVPLLHADAQLRPMVWKQDISVSSMNVRGGPVAVGQKTVTIPGPGNVLVRFDGTCISSPGDRIFLAASATNDWFSNDGNVSVAALDADVDQNSFSHSRMYTVTAGDYTFYAVSENAILQGGTGLVSIYGTLTVQYFPEAEDQPFVRQLRINQTLVHAQGTTLNVGQQSITTSRAGFALVRFDGSCVSDSGGVVALSASNSTGYSGGVGQVTVAAARASVRWNSFSHSRMYSVPAGTTPFYALASGIGLPGSGNISVYGSLTVTFFPIGSGNASVAHEGFIGGPQSFRGAPVAVDSLTLAIPSAGQVVVHFDGFCYPDVGDRLVLAASDTRSWTPEAGNVTAEAPNREARPFSHTRVYDVSAGSSTFYAVVENYGETDGDGTTVVYANMTAEFISNELTAVDPPGGPPASYVLGRNYPNPFNPETNISYSLPKTEFVTLTVYDILGREVALLVRELQEPGVKTVTFDAGALPSGIYSYRITAGGFTDMKKMLLVK